MQLPSYVIFNREFPIGVKPTYSWRNKTMPNKFSQWIQSRRKYFKIMNLLTAKVLVCNWEHDWLPEHCKTFSMKLPGLFSMPNFIWECMNSLFMDFDQNECFRLIAQNWGRLAFEKMGTTFCCWDPFYKDNSTCMNSIYCGSQNTVRRPTALLLPKVY